LFLFLQRLEAFFTNTNFLIKHLPAAIFYLLPFFAEQPIKCFSANLFLNFYRDLPIILLKSPEWKWELHLLLSEVQENPTSK
jgi:hypothetical protein